jgi:phospholipid N-methyltransferase
LTRDKSKSGPNAVTRSPVTFFQQFLKHPRVVASVVPSSRFLERRVVEAAELDSAGCVVELGAGTGGTTQAILSAMPAEARLLSIEINADFHAGLERIGDPRLIPHLGSAEDLQAALEEHHLPAPEAVISGIPFSTMDRGVAGRILHGVARALAPGGRFVAYQLSGRVGELGEPILGQAQVELEPLNLPPMRVYRWEKDRG